MVSHLLTRALDWQSAHKDKKRAARQAARKVIPKRVEQVSQHQAFPNKPHAGYVRLPTASARTLRIAYDRRVPLGSKGGTPSVDTLAARGVTSANRRLRVTSDGRRVALHHDTTYAIATGTSIS